MVFLFGLIGKKLGHSISDLIFNSFFESSKKKGEYLLLEVNDYQTFCRFAKAALEGPFHGLNVTIPYKEWAYSIAETKSESALNSGAANVLYRRDSKINCDNTDVYGFSESLSKTGRVDAKTTALIIGAGGAAKASSVGFYSLGVRRVFITSRNKARALDCRDHLNKRIGMKVQVIEENEILKTNLQLDVIVNATPVGMYPDVDAMPVSEEILSLVSKDGLVFDLVYNPFETKLLSAAMRKSIKTLNGLEMLILQAAKAFEIWTGEYPDVEKAYKEAKEALTS